MAALTIEHRSSTSLGSAPRQRRKVNDRVLRRDEVRRACAIYGPSAGGPSVLGPRVGGQRSNGRQRGVAGPELSFDQSRVRVGHQRLSVRASRLPRGVTRMSAQAVHASVRLSDRAIAWILGTGVALTATSVVIIIARAIAVTS